MALCLVESLFECGRFEPVDQMERYDRWFRQGHLSSTGSCFDIGNTTREAIIHFERTGQGFSGSTDSSRAGNGSLMRLAPIPIFFYDDPEQVIFYAAESSRVTHGAMEAVEACRYFAGLLWGALLGETAFDLMSPLYAPVPGLWERAPLSPEVEKVARGSFRSSEESAIEGSGYVVKSLEAALWAFNRGKSFSESVLLAVNLGDDADTTGAICGQLAGAYWGASAIPEDWKRGLDPDITAYIDPFLERCYDKNPSGAILKPKGERSTGTY
jgi:ADP-ribosylglycohydrolase